MKYTTISGLAKAGEVGVETVRYYQRRGLLDIPDRAGGTRRYGEEDIRRLRFIRSAQSAGFTLEQIGELLALDTNEDRAGEDRARARVLARERLAALDAQIAGLEAARKSLRRLAHDCETHLTGPCPILTAFDQ